MALKLPIGISDFKKLRDEGCTYIDKTLCVHKNYAQVLKDRGITSVGAFGIVCKGKWSSLKLLSWTRYHNLLLLIQSFTYKLKLRENHFYYFT